MKIVVLYIICLNISFFLGIVLEAVSEEDRGIIERKIDLYLHGEQ